MRKDNPMMKRCSIVFLCLAFAVGAAAAADVAPGLKSGSPDLKSAGPLAFAPEGVLLVGDPVGAAIFAIDTGDRTKPGTIGAVNIDGIGDKLAGMLGTTAQELLINDMAVNPATGKVYLSVSRGKGPAALPVLARVEQGGKIEILPLENVKFAKAGLPNPPTTERQRMESITDLAYVDNRVFVAGLSNEEFASRLRAIPFPFKEADAGTSIEIFHGAHGQLETRSPIRTFASYKIRQEPYLLAAYTCTPLVKLPLADLRPGVHVKGTTVAELGNRNRPLDMVVFKKDGKDYILMANSSRGVMKITTDNIDKIDAITARVATTAGLPYETVESLKGVQQLDRLDDSRALILIQAESGSLNLQTIPLP
jgi:hypothetical protein